MMDEALQREVARRMGSEFARRGIDVVFVGSTAVVLQRIAPKTSKDVDTLAPVTLKLDDARVLMQRIAADGKLEMDERGWGVLVVAKKNEAGQTLWECDLIVPEGELVPPAAARLIRASAVKTEAGLAATPGHVVAMKAIAYGDCIGQQRPERARAYQQDLEELRKRLRAVDWPAVQRLLDAFPDARAAPAVRLLREIFGAPLREPDSYDVG